jgi:uncharacterized membrane protein YkvI
VSEISNRFLRVYVVPGAVFQSVMVGGGYGTGREIVEFFTAYGAIGGLLGLGVAWLLLATVLAVTFELARRHGDYDYRSFFKRLLGPGWVAFEVLMVLLFLLILAVLASAAGNILRDNFGIPYGAGLAVMLAVVGLLTFFGRELIEKVLTLWSAVLYAAFIAFFFQVFASEGVSLAGELAVGDVQNGWLTSGLKYALYNLAVAPLLLYVVRGIGSRGEALRSGAVAGLIALAPAVLAHLAFLSARPGVLDEAIPTYWMLAQLGLPAMTIVFSIVLFGTFIETGAGLLQGINERIDAYLAEKRGKGLGPSAHAAIAVAAILLSAALSLIGITSLIAQGYGTMSWGFLFVYVLPVLTIGIWRLARSASSP